MNMNNAKSRLAAIALATLAIGSMTGCPAMSGGSGNSGPKAEDIASVPAGAVDPSVERYQVPVGTAAVAGPGNAKVTIIEYSDFQCPFCSRVVPTLDSLEKKYGKDLRVAFKNNPLPFHENAMPAAQASVAAQKQGKFWEMYALMFKNQGELKEASFDKWAAELKLDVAKFKKDYADPSTRTAIQAEVAEAAKFGARGTPSFFINGRPLRGAQPLDAFVKIVDEELKNAATAMQKGVSQAQLYAAFTKAAKAQGDQPKPQAPPPVDTSVYKALVGDAPVKGAKDAKVTIVEFSDFQCPYCSRVEPTIDQVVKAFPNDVRVAFKQLPLPFHPFAHPAAEAALAAKEQGKFWEMHAILFKNQGALDRPSLEKYATELGLNLPRFKEALDKGKFKAKVDAEMLEGNKIGARGTPSFFVNGKMFVGAQPFDAFKAKIEEEIKNATALMEKEHIGAGKVYDTLMANAKEGTPPPSAQAQGAEPAPEHVDVTVGNAPVKGGKSAKVTIVQFSDFQCPFCSRVEPTMNELQKTYGDKIRIAWKNQPLPFHQFAQSAAEASMAAGAQNKFWEMHAKMFANQGALDRPSLEKYAGEIGLDMSRFKADLDGGKWKEAVQKDSAEGTKAGASGTPTFFVNGWKLVGAQPPEAFKKLIDQELKK